MEVNIRMCLRKARWDGVGWMHRAQTGSGAHAASYTICIGGSYPAGKEAGA